MVSNATTIGVYAVRKHTSKTLLAVATRETPVKVKRVTHRERRNIHVRQFITDRGDVRRNRPSDYAGYALIIVRRV